MIVKSSKHQILSIKYTFFFRDDYEPSKFFGYKIGDESFIWLNRVGLRDYETLLKNRFLEWLENEPQKINKAFNLLDVSVHEEFDKRSKPFHMVNSFELHFK